MAQRFKEENGAGPLHEELHEIFGAEYPPSLLYRFLARLSHHIRELRVSDNMLIVTTNYDDSLERAFAEEGEPFELLVYAFEGGGSGWFRHTTVDGEQIDIRKNRQYFGINVDHCAVIVKILGSVDRADRDSYVITEDHYVDYLRSGGSEAFLPLQVAARLRSSHLLFLGYALGGWESRAMLNLLRDREGRPYRSWAYQNILGSDDSADWRQLDIRVLEGVGFGAFIKELEWRLSGRSVDNTRSSQRLPIQWVEQRLPV